MHLNIQYQILRIETIWSEKSLWPANKEVRMNKYHEQDCELYYGKDIVAAFIPEIKQVDVLSNQVTNEFGYRYHVSIKKKMFEYTHEVIFSSLLDIPFHKYWKECAGAEMLTSKQKKWMNQYLCLKVESAPKIEIPCFGCIGDFDDINKSIDWPELEEYLFKLLSIKRGEAGLLLLCEVAAILKPLFEKDKYPMDFYILIYGKSGIGKTTLAKLFFCQEEGQCKSFKCDTHTSIKVALEKYKGNTVLVDDYHPEASDYGRKKQMSIKDLISRGEGNAGTALAIVTAEFREGVFSTQDREVQIEFSDTQLQWEILESCRQNIQLYKILLYRICCVVYENKETIHAMISNRREETGEFRISHNVNMLKKVVDILFFVSDKTPLGEIMKKRISRSVYEKEYFYRLLDELEAKQKQDMKFVSQNGCDIDWIECFYDMVYVKEVFCRMPIDEMKKNGDDGNCIYLDGDEICISEMTLIDGVRRYFSYSHEQMAEARKMKTRLLSTLKSENLLLEDASASNTKKKRKRRFYVIDFRRLEMFCGEAHRSKT